MIQGTLKQAIQSMECIRRCGVYVALAALVSIPAFAQDNGKYGLAKKALVSIDGRPIASSQDGRTRVYCFLGVDCPVSRFYAERLESQHKSMAGRGVEYIGVFSNLQDSKEDIEKLVSQLSLTFPMVRDDDQVLAKQLGVKRVPEVCVVDRASLVRYQGRIDDQMSPGVKRYAVTQDDLKLAVEAVLEDREPPVARTDAVGCLITFSKEASNQSSLTYCKDIAPIFNRHCVECHRPNEIGPFDITDFREVRGWVEMIGEVMEQNRMPPWHADPAHGSFKNARFVEPSELSKVKQWIASGAPFGDEKDLPPRADFVGGWELSKQPDLVVAMRDRPYAIPASGEIDYQYFVVDPQLKEDRWVSGAQVIPANRSVVHHAIVFFRPPDGNDAPGAGWLTAYVPGQRITPLPTGYARKIPAGSKLVFQMHYTTNGKEQLDKTQVGLTFVDESEVTHEVFTLIGIEQEFEIPPSTEKHVVSSEMKQLPAGGKLVSITPHMHLRGKSFEMNAVYRDKQGDHERRDTLLNVPHYDFNWQHTYELSEPVDLDQIQSLQFHVTFDNSKANPFNPNPDEYVVWGDQTWEEMAVVFVGVAKPRSSQPSNQKLVGRNQSSSSEQAGNDSARGVAYLENFFSKFDADRNGEVSIAEVPRIVRDYSFRRLDENGDQKVTKDEMASVLRKQRDR